MYCAWRITAHLRCTQCSILLHLMDICFMTCIRSSRALILSNISTGTGSVLIRCRPEGICCDAAFRMMVRNLFSPFWQFVGSRLLLSLSSISLRYRLQFPFFKLKLVQWGIGLIVKSICKLIRIGRWSESRFVFRLPVGRSDQKG